MHTYWNGDAAQKNLNSLFFFKINVISRKALIAFNARWVQNFIYNLFSKCMLLVDVVGYCCFRWRKSQRPKS